MYYNKNIKEQTNEFLQEYFKMSLNNNKEVLECLQDAVDLLQSYKEMGNTELYKIIKN